MLSRNNNRYSQLLIKWWLYILTSNTCLIFPTLHAHAHLRFGRHQSVHKLVLIICGVSGNIADYARSFCQSDVYQIIPLASLPCKYLHILHFSLFVLREVSQIWGVHATVTGCGALVTDTDPPGLIPSRMWTLGVAVQNFRGEGPHAITLSQSS